MIRRLQGNWEAVQGDEADVRVRRCQGDFGRPVSSTSTKVGAPRLIGLWLADPKLTEMGTSDPHYSDRQVPRKVGVVSAEERHGAGAREYFCFRRQGTQGVMEPGAPDASGYCLSVFGQNLAALSGTLGLRCFWIYESNWPPIRLDSSVAFSAFCYNLAAWGLRHRG